MLPSGESPVTVEQSKTVHHLPRLPKHRHNSILPDMKIFSGCCMFQMICTMVSPCIACSVKGTSH